MEPTVHLPTRRAAAAYLPISTRKLGQLASSGQIIDACVRFEPVDVGRFIGERKMSDSAGRRSTTAFDQQPIIRKIARVQSTHQGTPSSLKMLGFDEKHKIWYTEFSRTGLWDSQPTSPSQPKGMAMEDSRILLPRIDAAKELAISPDMLSKLAVAGLVKVVRIGTKELRFRRHDLQEYAASLTAKVCSSDTAG